MLCCRACPCVLPPQMQQVDNGAGHKVWANRYDAKIVKTEEDSAHNEGGHEPIIPVVINEDDSNVWGSPRGYKVCVSGMEVWLVGGALVGRQ